MKRQRESYRVTFDTLSTDRAVYRHDNNSYMQSHNRHRFTEPKPVNKYKKFLDKFPNVIQQIIRDYTCREGRTDQYMILYDNLPTPCRNIIKNIIYNYHNAYWDEGESFPLQDAFTCYECKIMFSKTGPNWDNYWEMQIQIRDGRTNELTGNFEWQGFCSKKCANICFCYNDEQPEIQPEYIY